ncbi:hypothetical protein [Aestuariimicrobium sp. Y1814]|uniref:hypothetical protein n=1 Tax=Aestuariimicrobium sp. Y1814 TaxID=3418742 RepID=UPI003DA79A40
MGNRDNTRRLRPIWNVIIANNQGWTCRRCQKPIRPGEPYDLGHAADADPSRTHETHDVEPEHPFCNRSAGSKARNKLGKLNPSRDW